MESSEESQSVVINDLLSFSWCKLNLYSKQNLLKALKSFYSKVEADKSMDILLQVLPLKQSSKEKILKLSKDSFEIILNLLKYVSGRDNLPLFVCQDLNNIPKIEEENTSKVCTEKKTLFEEHRHIEMQLSQVFECIHELKDQFKNISENNFIQSNSTAVQEKGFKSELNSSDLVKDITNTPNDAEEINVDTIDSRLIANRHIRTSMRRAELSKKFALKSEFELRDERSSTMVKEEITSGDSAHSFLFTCPTCGYSSNDGLSIHSHCCRQFKEEVSKPAPKTPPEKKKKFTCQVCGLSSDTQRSYKTHVLTHFESDYRCPLCTERFPAVEWIEHVRGCGGLEGSPAREDIHCVECDVFFADKTIIGYHRGYHDLVRPFECLECKFRFYTQKSIEEHFRTHTAKDYKYKCPFCYVRGPGQKKIWEHIRCHTGDKPYKCQLCDHAASNPYNLKCHMRCHTQKKEFKCSHCDKSFKSKSKLNTHQRVHTNAKQYKCPVCGKGFNFGVYMTLHHKRHFEAKTHDCPECSFKGSSASLLRKHVSTHVDAKLFRCHLCPFGSNFKSYFRLHGKK